jgi:hypothetical protein
MTLQVVNGAQLACNFGSAPNRLVVPPLNMSESANQPEATVDDHAPMVNIMPFGLCMSVLNPQVAAATAAALGVLTPQPCVPATATAWMPGALTVQIAHRVALDDASMCACQWGGMVTVTMAGQNTTAIP